MPAQEQKALENDDIQRLFEQLKHEVERAGSGDGALRSRARATAERFWPVSAERPIERRPGPKGFVAYPVKQVLRRLMRWYVEPLAAEQRGFNDAALKLIDDLSERLDREHAAREQAARLLREAEERLLRLERRGSEAAPVTVATQPRADALPDYFAFESRMRGSTDRVRRGQRAYVHHLRDAAPVLDVGCRPREVL